MLVHAADLERYFSRSMMENDIHCESGTESDDEERKLMVRQKDNESERFLKGEYGEFIHRDDQPCEDAPDRGILRFDIKRGNGSADLCPDCEWPDWVVELREAKELMTDGGHVANEDDSQESECGECEENRPGHEVLDGQCHKCFIDHADRILETTPDDLVTDGGQQVYLDAFEDAVETADNEIDCPHGRGDCPGVLDAIEAFELTAAADFSMCEDCFDASLSSSGYSQ